MEVLAVVSSALTLAIVSAASNYVLETKAKNDTTFEGNKIVGGFLIDIRYVPWQVAILERDSLLCAGNIIKNNAILTAAHCMVNRAIELLKIRAGSNYYNQDGRVVAATGKTIHDQYVFCDGCFNFDIALLFLESSATAVGVAADTIALWDTGTIFAPGTEASLAGWGATEEGGSLSVLLRRAILPIVNEYKCAFYGQHVPDYNLCAGYSKGGVDFCHGDSGTGLVINDKLAGIAAFGRGCGRRNVPGGYASVPVFRNWIREKAGV